MADKGPTGLNPGSNAAAAVFHGVEGGNSRGFTGQEIADLAQVDIADVDGLQAELDSKIDDSQAGAGGLAVLGAANAAAVRAAAGVVIGTDVQAYSSVLATYSGITPSANVQTLLGAADFAAFRTALGTGTGDSPEFTAINLGHASDTTISRSSAGNIAVEGNLIYRAGGTDVPLTDGGTGASTAAGARTNLELAKYEALATAPVMASFSWVNQGTATGTDGTGGIILRAPAAATNVRILEQNAPATPYSVYIRLQGDAEYVNGTGVGIVLRNSTSGRFNLLCFNSSTTSGTLQRILQRWASATSFNANVLSAVNVWGMTRWLKVDVSATGITGCSTSQDGVNWNSLSGFTETFATYVTATGGSVDKIGFAVRPEGAVDFLISHFGTTAPV